MPPSLQPDEDRRQQSDRRQVPTSIWDSLRWRGQRTEARRAAERSRPYFVDRFPPVVLLWIMLLIFGCLLDAVLTVRLIEAGGTEINPVMQHLLDRGTAVFFIGKYLLTVAGLPLLLIYKNHYLPGGRLRVQHLFPAFVVAYAILIAYQCSLMLTL